MRSWIVPVGFCLFFFVVPLQCFIMGSGMGVGIQGAVYRFQVTGFGESIIPITTEISYVIEGKITGKTATSIILWTTGTIVFLMAVVCSLIFWGRFQEREILLLTKTAALSSVLFIAALCTQYGIFLSGPAGVSYPVGLLIMILFIVSVYYYRNWLLESTSEGTGL